MMLVWAILTIRAGRQSSNPAVIKKNGIFYLKCFKHVIKIEIDSIVTVILK